MNGQHSDRVDLEEVDLAIELELDHPVDQSCDVRVGRLRCSWMQREQTPARVTDDAAGVVSPGDHLDRTGERSMGDFVDLDRVHRRHCRLKDVVASVHLPAVRVRRMPPMQVSARTDQREHLIT